jgi:hypothetical protein
LKVQNITRALKRVFLVAIIVRVAWTLAGWFTGAIQKRAGRVHLALFVAGRRVNSMPHEIRKVKGGSKVFSPNGSKGKKPLTYSDVRSQQQALYVNAPDKRKK